MPNRIAPPARRTLPLLLALLAACGGGDDGGTGPGDITLPNGTMTARVNGQPWRATFVVQATVSRQAPNTISLFQISGVDTVGTGINRPRQIIVTVAGLGVATPGTYQLMGPSGGQTSSGQGQFTIMSSIWNTAVVPTMSGGTITVTSLTAERIAGTFSFTAPAAASNPAADRQPVSITEGEFDIRITAQN